MKKYNEDPQTSQMEELKSIVAEELTPYAEKATVIEKSTYSSLDAPEVIAALEGKNAVVLTAEPALTQDPTLTLTQRAEALPSHSPALAKRLRTCDRISFLRELRRRTCCNTPYQTSVLDPQ